jgi:endonuclease YncB( thermonuclease family)
MKRKRQPIDPRGAHKKIRRRTEALIILAVLGALGRYVAWPEFSTQKPEIVQLSQEDRVSGETARAIPGRVVKVADGDTVTLLDSQKKQIKVRLLGIDAPEKAQPFGNRCREELAQVIQGQTVEIASSKKDRYGRVLGKLVFQGRDLNLAQVRAGCAWHYKQFAREQEPADRKLYAEAEREARAAKRGLWSTLGSKREPEAPWEHRQAKRENGRKSRSRGLSAAEQDAE